MSDIKNAATIVLLRKIGVQNFVLMGKRSSKASFMPNKYVFPGGSWELGDCDVPFSSELTDWNKKLLMLETDFSGSTKLGMTVVRELWEETGLKLSSRGQFKKIPLGWEQFFLDDQGPNLSVLNFFFRAVTPPGRARRFDARFFFCDSSHIKNDLDYFGEASGELKNLQWIEVTQTKDLVLPLITRIALDHLITLIDLNLQYKYIPFYSGGSNGLLKQELIL